MFTSLWEISAISYFIPIIIIGIAGNIWTICSLIRIFYTKIALTSAVFKHMSLYILSLGIADLMVLSMAPFLLHYLLVGDWQFGHFGCKVFFTIETGGKLWSVGILTVISCERFLVIRRPPCYKMVKKYVSNLLVVVCALLLLVIILSLPITYYAGTETLMTFHTNETFELTTICSSNLPDNVMSIFISYMFVLGYLLPVSLICLCYFFLIRYLKQMHLYKNVNAYTSSVIRSIILVIMFHLICWTPFWTFVLIPMLSYIGLVPVEFLELEYIQTLRMISSFLLYMNSAGNWIFYAAMNRELVTLNSSSPNAHLLEMNNWMEIDSESQGTYKMLAKADASKNDYT